MPKNTAEQELKEAFYEQLKSALEGTPNRDIMIVHGDLNAKVGKDNITREIIIGERRSWHHEQEWMVVYRFL